MIYSPLLCDLSFCHNNTLFTTFFTGSGNSDIDKQDFISTEPITSDGPPGVTESEDRGDHVSKRSKRARSVVRYEEDQAEPSSSKTNRTKIEKKFVCEECNYSTEYRCYLKRHKLTHTGEKPYACDQCLYRAAQAFTLKKHKMTHSGEKP